MIDIEKSIQKILGPAIPVGEELRSKIRHDFTLGMTKYVCKNGTLGDGFEKGLSIGLVYPQACKEAYVRAFEAQRQSSLAKKAKSKFMKAEERLLSSRTEYDRLDAEADMELAHIDLMQAEDNAKDLIAQFEEFDKIRKELEPEFHKRYPDGIEQAEEDNWLAVAKYRALKSPNSEMQSLPLPLHMKAALGVQWNRPDMVAPLAVLNPEAPEVKYMEKKMSEAIPSLQKRIGNVT